jgi:hypothetical protein
VSEGNGAVRAWPCGIVEDRMGEPNAVEVRWGFDVVRKKRDSGFYGPLAVVADGWSDCG